MKKKLLSLLIFGFGALYANPVNWVVAKVNNEPITNFEIQDIMKKTGSKNRTEALEYLINEKLQIAEIKKRDITASPYEVTRIMEDIAKRNNKTLEQLEAEIKKSGTSVEQFRSNLANDIMQQKLLGSIFEKADKRVTPEKVKEFYAKNPMAFTTYDSVTATRFAAQTKKEIEDAVRGNVGMFVFSHQINIPRSSLNEQTAFAFMNMRNGEFTPIMKHPEGFYEVLRIDSKNGLRSLPLEQVEDRIIRILAENERRKEADVYFERLRANAVIEMLEQPK
ncbi:MAG: hypothetical protein GX282_03810 [Campylobacteraceae bacterium]|nr:hypothetical protein [Campylobacteraceae bacterium]